MDTQIQNYADSLYEQAQMDSLRTMNEAKVEFLHRRAALGGQFPLGGTEIAAMNRFHVENIERCMAARLESYRTAYSESDQIPTDEDFTTILAAFQNLRQLQVTHSAAAIKSFIQSRGGAAVNNGATESLMNGSAHGHDRVLRDWKVWREKVRLQRTRKHNKVRKPESFSINTASSAFQLLYPDFRDYIHYFNEDKLKEAVAAAFERYENRLNEIRDNSRKATVKNAAGRDLVYQLFTHKVLKRPYKKIGRNATAKVAYEQGLTGILAGGVSWIRNAYTHEKHKLPDINEAEALELLFVASYLMRMLDLCKK
jgi:hypothetical protein